MTDKRVKLSTNLRDLQQTTSCGDSMPDKRAHLSEINRDWGWWTPEARNGARIWMTVQLEAAWAEMELLREANGDLQKSAQYCPSCGQLLPTHAEWCGRSELVIAEFRTRAEVAEKQLADTRLWRQTLADTCDELRAQRDRLREALEEIISDGSSWEQKVGDQTVSSACTSCADKTAMARAALEESARKEEERG